MSGKRSVLKAVGASLPENCFPTFSLIIVSSLVFLAWFSSSQGQSSFFVAREYRSPDEYFCVTNTSFALSWIHKDFRRQGSLERRYIPQQPRSSCDIANDPCTTAYFLAKPWSLQYSFNQIILDERWEDMTVTETSFLDGQNRILRFERTLRIEKTNFEVAFSVLLEKEGHIFLCDGEDPSESNCYWFMLQAFGGNVSAIRKCAKGQVPSRSEIYPKEPCNVRRVFIEHPKVPLYLSSSRWSHFVISKQDKQLTFSWHNGSATSKIMEWQDEEMPIVVTHMIVHSKINNGLWKIHILDFIYTTVESKNVQIGDLLDAPEGFICISMYIWMCPSCKLKLSLSTQKGSVNEMTYEREHAGWNRIRFISENLSNGVPMKLLVSTIGTSSDRYWAMDKFRLCEIEEFRMIRLRGKAAPCQLMSGTTKLITFEEKAASSESNCPEDTIGPFCVKCDLIFYNYCQRVTICTEDQCVCSAGYYDQQCYYECPQNSYGHGCRKTCGNCQYPCNKVDGTCPSSMCADDYSGPNCDILPSTIASIFFTKPPNVTAITYHGATVTVSDFEITNTRNNDPPQYYKIQYREQKSDDTFYSLNNPFGRYPFQKSYNSDSSWIDYNRNFTFQTRARVKIENLEPDTHYLVRSVIASASGMWQIDNNELKITEFTTLCQEITDSNISVKVFKTSVFIYLVQNKNLTCKSYTFSLEETPNRAYFNQGEVAFTGLKPSTKYTLRVQRKQKTFEKVFTTLADDVSEAPYDLKIRWTLENSLMLEWKHPKETNGKIDYFDISIRRTNESSGIRRKLSIPDEKYNSTYYYQVHAADLRPTTQYKITIFAFNGKPGVSVTAITTSPPEIPTLATEPLLHPSNHSIDLAIFLKNLLGKTDNYRIIILRSDTETNNLDSYHELQNFDLGGLRILIDCNFTNVYNSFFLIVGQSQQLIGCQDVNNSSLEPGTPYNITIVLMNTYHGKTRTKIYSMATKTTGESSPAEINSALFALLALLLIIPAVAFCYLKRKATQRTMQLLGFNDIGQSNAEHETDQIRLLQMQPKTKKDVNPTKKPVEIHENLKDHSKLVSIKIFNNYFKTALENQELQNQYENILETVLTYETVVVDTLRSDYVDMNFNNGLQIKNAYIISKWPTIAEFNEFWKVIVDENINHIVLFAHLHPNKKKMKNYWPDVGKTLQCGNVIIECNMCEKYMFYAYRKFSLKCKNKIRKIDQLHLSLPPNDRRYLSSLNYVQFFQKMSRIPQSPRSPILVHSSAGMRGISFALLCDMSLRSARKDGVIDVMASFKRLVQTTTEMKIEFDHYVAAHAIIADTLNHMDTSIACNSFDDGKPELFTKEEIQKHVQYLEDTLWLDRIIIQEEKDFYVNCPTIRLKSELRDVEHEMPSIDRSQLEQSDFLQVTGFKASGTFWVAKQPISTPLSDFLEKVQEKNISVIVALNDNIFTWPSEDHPEMVISNDLTLNYKFIKKLRSYDWITLELKTNTTIHMIDVVSFKNWSAPVASSPNVADFVNFVIGSHEIFQNIESVLVTCHDGVTSSGLYLAMTYITQKIKAESVCDVCTCIRVLRRHCQAFVKDNV